jgi:light-regulated signal transduction histidine kinase (bacteriophytochrome)
MTASAIALDPVVNSSQRGPTDFARALLNILDDFVSEQNQLRHTQNAVLNILDDSASERGHFRDTQRAVLNTLEDFAEEKHHLEKMESAVLNILEDLGTERDKLQEAQIHVRERTAELDRTNERLVTMNEELKGSSLRLEQSNRELQDFASVASHDLQEPLRKVQAFGDRLKSGSGAALDAQGRDYLERMLSATKRMQSLIQDLLSFCRVTSQARLFMPVDLAQVAREVLSDLEVRIAETNASVDVGNLPTIDADAVQMRQLLQNLIGNALKFHQKGKPPAVRLYAERATDGMLRLVVEDNGIGFEEKYLDRIFTVFQRLHSRAEYAGTGVGLAICRKIAQRHGGDITAKSAPGVGTSFVVALPYRHVNGNGLPGLTPKLVALSADEEIS